MENITRRSVIKTLTGGAAIIPLFIEGSCGNANTILNAINDITNDADEVLTALEASVCTVAETNACVNASVFAQIMTWLTALQTANTQALVIDAGASTLTAAQIADIAAVYSKVVLGNIGPLPSSIQTWITVTQVAITTLLQILGTTQAAANVAPRHAMVLSISWDRLESARVKNAALKSHLGKTQAFFANAHHK